MRTGSASPERAGGFSTYGRKSQFPYATCSSPTNGDSSSKLRVTDSKTDAGIRILDLSPMLLDELKLHRAESLYAAPEDFVFATGKGTRRHRCAVMGPIILPAIERANVELAKAGGSPIEGLTNHSMRRTFCALLHEAGASPAYVMSQMGHTDASLALEVYAKVMERQRDTGERMDALIRGAEWAETGRNADLEVEALPALATENPAGAGLF